MSATPSTVRLLPPLCPPPELDSRGLPVGYAFQPEWETTPRQTRDMLRDRAAGKGDGVLLDCRREEEWNASRIDGAVLIPMDEIAMRLDELETADGGRDRPIVVQCHTGKRSLKVTAILRANGFTNVRSMAGGIELWSSDIDPKVPRYTK